MPSTVKEPSARILLVEDSISSQRVVKSALRTPDFDIICAASLTQARSLLSQEPAFDLILLDLHLPDGEGLEFLHECQGQARLASVPTFVLTGTTDVQIKVAAFQMGAEDFLIKPISPLELRARVDARIKKSAKAKMPADSLQRGRLTFNFPLMRAILHEDGHDTQIDFTAKEFRLVATMAQHEGQIFSRAELVKEIWGQDMHVVNRTVDSHICGARRKLKSAGDYIQSITGAGYRFVAKD